MTSEESLGLFKQLVKVKKEAIAKLKKVAASIYIEEVEVINIYMSASESVHDLEELEIFLHMDLLFVINNIYNANIAKLMRTGKITLLGDTSTQRAPGYWNITYETSYSFEYDEGKVTASFSG